MGSPCCGGPCNKSHTIWGLYSGDFGKLPSGTWTPYVSLNMRDRRFLLDLMLDRLSLAGSLAPGHWNMGKPARADSAVIPNDLRHNLDPQKCVK